MWPNLQETSFFAHFQIVPAFIQGISMKSEIFVKQVSFVLRVTEHLKKVLKGEWYLTILSTYYL